MIGCMSCVHLHRGDQKHSFFPTDMPRATFFRCLTVTEPSGVALYAAIKWRSEGWILRWRQQRSGELVLEGRTPGPITRSPICGMALSPSGSLLAAVTPDGDQVVVSCRRLRRVLNNRGAHMTFATAITFSPDEACVLSISADASAVITRVPRPGAGNMLYLLALLGVLLALLVHFLVMGGHPTLSVIAIRGS